MTDASQQNNTGPLGGPVISASFTHHHPPNHQYLQHIQNNLVRVVCQRGGCTDAGPMLRPLYWIPVRQWVPYQTALIAHKVQATATPTYLSDLLHICVTLHKWLLPLVQTPMWHAVLSVPLSSHPSPPPVSLHLQTRRCSINAVIITIVIRALVNIHYMDG